MDTDGLSWDRRGLDLRTGEKMFRKLIIQRNQEQRPDKKNGIDDEGERNSGGDEQRESLFVL